MLSQHTKVALASAWIMTAVLIGALGNMTSIAAGALVLGCAWCRRSSRFSTILASATPS